MSTLGVIATLQAAADRRAVPITSVRHTHIADRPFVVIPLGLAGEACAPLAALVGADRGEPRLLVAPQPKNRTDRFRLTAEFAALLLPYLDDFTADTETYEAGRGAKKEQRVRCTDAPQLVVPNPGAAAFLRLLGRSTRFRRTEGPYAVDPGVPRLGQWLTWFADQAEFATSSLELALTRVLSAHWATGQSPVEDAHLPALMGWIDPPKGWDGPTAARWAEDPANVPPAGPATDPEFDRILVDLYAAVDKADHSRRRAAAVRQLEAQLLPQLLPTWDLMWRALDLLRSVPPAGKLAARWQNDRDGFTYFAEYLASGGLPQARRDHASGAARRLARLEDAANRFDAERALDDPLVMAEYELTGEAVVGTVTGGAPDRTVLSKANRISLRPMVTLSVPGPGRFRVGDEVRSPARQAQEATVLAIRGEGDGPYEIDLELSKGMGRSQRPPAPPGSVPALGEEVCYTSVSFFSMPAALPDDEATPWTHGGPPPPHRPTDDDANEVWE
ncbi:hypothetical protein [Streptomyces sp. NPDC088910]|uniref:hypothetical protein n=1 Tax=Streptomyces sp. NPDC088910 TaxID=3365911 RepID=UPI0038130FF3